MAEVYADFSELHFIAKEFQNIPLRKGVSGCTWFGDMAKVHLRESVKEKIPFSSTPFITSVVDGLMRRNAPEKVYNEAYQIPFHFL